MSRIKVRVPLERLQRRVAEDPESAESRLRLGTALFKVGLASRAEAELLEAVRLDPACIAAWINLGGIRLARWDFKGSIEANERALALEPELVQGYFNKGLGHMYLGDTAEMVRCFEKVVGYAPNRGDGQYYLAVALTALGQRNRAQRHLARAMALGYSPEPELVRELERAAEAELVPLGPNREGGDEELQIGGKE